MRFAEVVARLAVLPEELPEPPRELNPVLLGPVGVQSSPACYPLDPAAAARSDRDAADPPSIPSDTRLPWPPGPRRRAAALVLVYPGTDGEAFVILIRRPQDDSRHAGEVALPAGEIEPDDASPTAAALREAAEEVGLDPVQAGLHVLGELGVVEIRASGFELTPVLALASREPVLRANPCEVAALHRVPLRHFLAGAPIQTVEEERRAGRLRYGAYPADGLRVWGATARVLGQLGAILGG